MVVCELDSMKKGKKQICRGLVVVCAGVWCCVVNCVVVCVVVACGGSVLWSWFGGSVRRCEW